MVRWYHQLSGHESEQTQTENSREAWYYSPWGCKGSDTTEQLTNSNNKEPGSYRPSPRSPDRSPNLSVDSFQHPRVLGHPALHGVVSLPEAGN